MSDDLKIADLESVLRARRAAMLVAIRDRMHQSDDPAVLALANQVAEVGDRLSTDFLSDSDIVLLNDELKELGDIDGALARIATGTYGVCASCGVDIPGGRLAVMPTASRCVACEEKAESRATHAHATQSL
jgi:DnaK suppressor protein